MISKCANAITEFIVKKTLIEVGDKDIYKYGFEMIISVVVNLFFVILAGLLFNQVLLSIISFFVFAMIRMQCGGYHADSYIKCNLYLFITFILIMFFTYSFKINSYSRLFFLLVHIYVPIFMVAFAPVKSFQSDNESEVEKRTLKIKSVVRVLICEVIGIIGWILNWKELTASVIFSLGAVCILLAIETGRRNSS